MQPTESSVRVRPAEAADVERLVAIHMFAFPDPRGHEARVTNFTANPLGGLDRLRVAYDTEDRARIVGHAFLFELDVFVGGRPIRTGAIATVGVEPAARGRGIATQLMKELSVEAKRGGMALTMLHAYRQGFYTRLGYEPVTPYQRLLFAPTSIPRTEEHAEENAPVVRPAHGRDRVAIERTYERAGARGNGFFRRSTALWDNYFADERLAWVVAESGGEVHAAIAYRLLQTEHHAKVALHVDDFFAADDAAARALVAHLGGLRDQVAEIEWSLPWGDPLALALIDADSGRFGDAVVEHAVGRVCAGPMVKVEDARALLAARGYARDGETVLAFSMAAHGARWADSVRLVVRGGRAEVSPAPRDRAEIVLDRGASAVLAGGVLLVDAQRLGWARAASEDSLARANALLATPPFFTHDTF